jgi:hypothetical protein
VRHAWVVVGLLLAAAGCTPSAAAAPTPAPVPADLVGVWERRDAYLVVGSGGAARFRWQTNWCGPQVAEPCDLVIGDAMQIGAHAEIGLQGPDPASPATQLVGQVVSVAPTGLLTLGPVILVRLAPDLVELRQATRQIQLCRPPRDLNFCDALM